MAKKFYDDVVLPPVLNWINEEEFKKQFHTEVTFDGFTFKLSSYFKYRLKTIKLKRKYFTKIHNKNWIAKGGKILLKRHKIYVKSDQFLSLGSLDVVKVVRALMFFLAGAYRSVRELVLSIPKHPDVEYDTKMENFKMYSSSPLIVSVVFIEGEYFFQIVLPLRDVSKIQYYQFGVVDPIDPDDEDIEMEVFFPLFCFKSVGLNR